jgi:hypothetical protein
MASRASGESTSNSPFSQLQCYLLEQDSVLVLQDHKDALLILYSPSLCYCPTSGSLGQDHRRSRNWWSRLHPRCLPGRVELQLSSERYTWLIMTFHVVSKSPLLLESKTIAGEKGTASERSFVMVGRHVHTELPFACTGDDELTNPTDQARWCLPTARRKGEIILPIQVRLHVLIWV